MTVTEGLLVLLLAAVMFGAMCQLQLLRELRDTLSALAEMLGEDIDTRKGRHDG